MTLESRLDKKLSKTVIGPGDRELLSLTHQPSNRALCTRYQWGTRVHRLIRILGIVLIAFAATATLAAQPNGNANGRGNGNGNAYAYGQQEREVVSVPEPATLTLLGLGIGGGLLARRWASRRKAPRA